MSYIDDHPTMFDWNPEARAVVERIQDAYPWRTYINTYLWHPPYQEGLIERDYRQQTFDIWGGGLNRNNEYTGFRGKPLPKRLGKAIFGHLWRGDFGGPGWAWGIYRGRMWVRGEGWGPAPPGPPDSDPDHINHIHITLLPF